MGRKYKIFLIKSMVQCLAKGVKSTIILHKLTRDNRTVKRFVSDSEQRRALSFKAY